MALCSLPPELLLTITDELMQSYATKTDMSIFSFSRVNRQLQDMTMGTFFRDQQASTTRHELLEQLKNIERMMRIIEDDAERDAFRRRSVSLC